MLKIHFSRSDGGLAWLRKFLRAVGASSRQGERSIRVVSEPAPALADASQRVVTRSAPRKPGPPIDLERRAKFGRVHGMAR
jgi:hypothetical protein